MKHGIRALFLALSRRVAGLAGYEIRRTPPVETTFTMAGLLARAAQHGLELGTAIDVGASNGKWSVKTAAHFPRARFLLVEPLVEREAELAALKAERPQFDYALYALGDRSGEAAFHVSEDLDGSGLSDAVAPAASRMVPVRTLDELVRERGLHAPFLLKLDTHGFELPILAGAAETLRQTALLIVEVYNFKIAGCALRFHEMCAHLETLGFRCCDLADPLLRKKDATLWQMDFAFIKNDDPLWNTNTFC